MFKGKREGEKKLNKENKMASYHDHIIFGRCRDFLLFKKVNSNCDIYKHQIKSKLKCHGFQAVGSNLI